MKNQQHFALLIFYIAKLFITIKFRGIKTTGILSHLNSRVDPEQPLLVPRYYINHLYRAYKI